MNRRTRKISLPFVLAASFFACTTTLMAEPFSFDTFRYPGTSISGALGINNAGQVVGFAGEAPGFTADPIGFLYYAGIFTPILYPGSTSTYATGISNSGVVVGFSSLGSFLYSNGVYTLLGLGGQALGINNSNQLVGTTGTSGFFYDGSVLHTIAYPGAISTTASGINNAGRIVGSYQISPLLTSGFLYNAGVFTPISVPGATSTYAEGINNLGEIVGYYVDAHGHHGFVDINGVFTTFEIPVLFDVGPVFLTDAFGINDDGVIAGSYHPQAAGVEFAYVATPTPEPPTLVLVLGGMVGLFGLVKLRRPVGNAAGW